jgi:hypothetical protein
MKHYPNLDELPEADVARLRALDAGDLHVRVEDWFTDDHMPCLDVEVNGVRLSLWWIPLRSAAAFYFTGDSPAARAEVVRVIRAEIDLGREDAGGGPAPGS